MADAIEGNLDGNVIRAACAASEGARWPLSSRAAQPMVLPTPSMGVPFFFRAAAKSAKVTSPEEVNNIDVRSETTSELLLENTAASG